MPRLHPTIREVAALAGVSHQTVSRVINGNERVSPETRRKVESAIAELGYSPNAVARSMAIGRTRMLGCFSPNLTDFTFASIIEGAEGEARKQGYFLVSSSAPDEATFSHLIEEMVNARRIEGLLVMNPCPDSCYDLLIDGFPTVFVGARPSSTALSSISLDDEAAGRCATGHLTALGHRRIAMITGPLAEDCSQDRWRGYESALHEAGIEPDAWLVATGDWSATSGYATVQAWLSSGVIFSALFAQNDRMAVGSIRALREAGLRVPQDVSVIGFDDMPLASYFDPPLTTIRQDTFALGRQAASLLIQAVEQPSETPQQVLWPAELVVRGSTAAFVEDR